MYNNWNLKNSFNNKFEQEEKKSMNLNIGQIKILSLRNSIKENWRKISKTSDTCETSSGIQIYAYRDFQEKRERDRKNIGRNNGWNFPKFDEIHVST